MLRKSAHEVFQVHLAAVVVAAAITVLGGLIRAATARFSRTEPSNDYPGGVVIHARHVTLATDVIATVAAAVVTFSVIAPPAGLAAAGGSTTVVVALGDIVASVVLVLRGQPRRKQTCSTNSLRRIANL